MAMVVSDSGALNFLKVYVNNTRPSNSLTLASANDLQLRLFATNVTPNANGGDTAATYTQAAGGGYAAKTLTNGSWTCASSNPSDATYAIQTWTFSGVLTTNTTIYGYYIVDSDGVLVTSEAITPFTPTASGTDTLSVTPKIQASYGTPAA
jgi:hypothetical protein